jgi:glucarate dehydratase
MQLHPIAVADGPLRSSYGLHAPYALRTIVELRSTDGFTGISETYGGDRPLAALEALRERVVGMDPFHLTGLWMDMEVDALALREASKDPKTAGRTQTWLVPGENPLDQHTRSFAAIEMACLDLIGKALGRPVCDLVGGRARDKVEFSAYLFYKHAGGGGLGSDVRDDEYGEALNPGQIVAQAARMIRLYGFREIKLKGGVFPPDEEIAAMKALREAFPDSPLRIDPNCAWSVETSVHVAESLRAELANGGYLEDPCGGLDGMAEVRKRLRVKHHEITMASNVSVTCFPHVVEAKNLDAVQVVLSDPHYWGGVRAQQRLSHLCDVMNMGLSMHSNNHLGVSLMQMAHAAAAAPGMTHACDTHYPWQTAKDEIVVGGRVPFHDGCVEITDRPGLGVELDYDQVARLEERYHKLPYRKRDDEAEMQRHIDPNWKRVLPRW